MALFRFQEGSRIRCAKFIHYIWWRSKVGVIIKAKTEMAQYCWLNIGFPPLCVWQEV
ncbi:MAG: hypothetical protein IPI42_07730 [Saprospiraceae bacterium]|nr:hypothetical protein [Candidatus Parvibacillus calidus]